MHGYPHEESPVAASSVDARRLADHIESLPGFAFVTFDVPYNHMGATLVDGVLQAGVRYATVVVPRVQRLRRDHPSATTTSAFSQLLCDADPHEILRWKGERKIMTLRTLTDLLLGHDVETEEDLLAFLNRPGSQAEVMAIKGLKDKSCAYLRFLAGAEDAVAVDRHMRRTLRDADVRASTFDEARRLYVAAAALLGVTPATLEYSVFLYGSSRRRHGR